MGMSMKAFYNEVIKYINPQEIYCIYDIGCMDSNDSIELSELFPNATIFGFEGLEDNFNKYLKYKTIPNVYFTNKVILDRDGYVDFYEKERNGIHSVHDRIL